MELGAWAFGCFTDSREENGAGIILRPILGKKRWGTEDAEVERISDGGRFGVVGLAFPGQGYGEIADRGGVV